MFIIQVKNLYFLSRSAPFFAECHMIIKLKEIPPAPALERLNTQNVLRFRLWKTQTHTNLHVSMCDKRVYKSPMQSFNLNLDLNFSPLEWPCAIE